MAIFTKPKLLFLFFFILSLFLTTQCDDQNPRGQDPRIELESCLRQCQVQGQRKQRPEQQLQCQRSCVDQYEQRQREKEQQHRGQETGDDNPGRQGQREPERRLRECQQRCQKQEQGQHQRQCQQRCQQEYQREQEQQRRGQKTGEELNPCKRDPERRFKACQQKCHRQEQEQGQQQQRKCQQRCQQEYQREQEQQCGGGEDETNPQREKEEEKNPYLFESQRFRSRFRARHGDFRVLEKFSERSELLRGIENFRVAVLEFEPQSFMLPHHCDAEAIFVVVRGQGIISIAEQDEKNSFNLQQGDVIRVPAGSTVYFLNRDNNERFFVYMLAKPVNVPGRFQEYFSAGGENPESFYRAFSSDILETAFNTPRDKLERLFGQQKQGVVIKVTEEQIRAISEHASRSTKQTEGETQGPFNLLKERPLFGSKFGQFFEATPERFQQLRDLDSAVGFMNINQGGMVLPYYNTRSTTLVMVVEGKGRFEMACPHLGSQSQRQGQGSRGGRRGQEQEEQDEGNVHYQKVRGQQSIWRNVEREAKEVSFNMPAKEVEEILQNQDQSYFVAAPEHRQQHRERGEEGRKGEQQYLSSILDFVF
ncbi:hypothetical protein RND71_022734 [Anisodus tanguticus]|uniref:Cupin type-1 domain-containing protein n=1 Tax=Anisodus tanguticus TaxID=243964 RepID=A0AAE1RTW4_9SOLA|nr:hypothetical protein RND71_022734 [Anisodus tanguticus]